MQKRCPLMTLLGSKKGLEWGLEIGHKSGAFFRPFFARCCARNQRGKNARRSAPKRGARGVGFRHARDVEAVPWRASGRIDLTIESVRDRMRFRARYRRHFDARIRVQNRHRKRRVETRIKTMQNDTQFCAHRFACAEECIFEGVGMQEGGVSGVLADDLCTPGSNRICADRPALQFGHLLTMAPGTAVSGAKPLSACTKSPWRTD